MSSINWPEVLAIFIGFGAFFIYLMSRLDRIKGELKGEIRELDKKFEAQIKELDKKIETEIRGLDKKFETEIRELDKKFEGLQKDLNRIDSKVSNIEGQITQMTRPNIIPIQRHQTQLVDDEPKEN